MMSQNTNQVYIFSFVVFYAEQFSCPCFRSEKIKFQGMQSVCACFEKGFRENLSSTLRGQIVGFGICKRIPQQGRYLCSSFVPSFSLIIATKF